MPRPVSKNPKGKNINIRVTDRDYELIQRAAEFAGMSVSDFCRGNLVTAASQVASLAARYRGRK